MESRLTICVTTFLRPESLQRCLDSIKQYYPNLPLLVEDTGGNLSAGRNRLVAKCKTPYFLLLEDDMEFTSKTKLEALLDVVENDEELIGCGGYVVDRGKAARNEWCHDFFEFRGKLQAIPSGREIRVSPDGTAYRLCQLISNFGVFRTAAVAKFPWDEELPVREHQNWYYSFRHDWLVGYTRQVQIYHYADRDGGEYDRYRLRSNQLGDKASERLGLKITPPTPIPRQILPNIILLGIGHSNTSITTRQIQELGWNAPDIDSEFMEARLVRKINKRLLDNEKVPLDEMISVLASYEQPWVIKDPRFHVTLGYWLAAFASYRPLLIRLDKSLERVRASYNRRGFEPSIEQLVRKVERCKLQYENWPWNKLVLSAENIAAAVALFDLDRIGIRHEMGVWDNDSTTALQHSLAEDRGEPG